MGVYIKGVTKSQLMKVIINSTEFMPDDFEVIEVNSSEKPNNCKYLTNPSGDAWECGCCLEIFCEHQIYDRNPDGTLNIVECGFEPKSEPTTEDSSTVDWKDQMWKEAVKTEPQTERSE